MDHEKKFLHHQLPLQISFNTREEFNDFIRSIKNDSYENKDTLGYKKINEATIPVTYALHTVKKKENKIL